MREFDVTGPGGSVLHVYDTERPGLAVFWHHGTPNIGAPPEPLFETADRLGLRFVSYDRPGYGGSTPRPGRDVGSAADDTAAVAAAIGIDRFALMGHSGGGPHALAAARLPGAVAAISVSGLAPYGADGLDWFAGMGPAGIASLRAALAGRAAKERHEAAAGETEPDFIPADWDALAGPWGWLGRVVGPAVEAGPAALIDDDLAYVAPWGFDPATVAVPVRLLHGGRDAVVPAGHSVWLAEHCPTAELRLFPDDGHISVLTHADSALAWLVTL